MSKIARVWHGKVPASQIEEYVEYVKRTGIRGLTATKGNLGAWIFTRVDGDLGEVSVISFWESKEAIRQFAGDNISRAVYYPDDSKYLISLDPELLHYDVAVEEVVKA